MIGMLKKCDNPKAVVFFDFGELVPTGLHSYRGFYDHLAFSFDRRWTFNGKDEKDNEIDVAGLLKMCEDALGRTFQGYKGGDYVMNPDTPLWVSDYAEASSTAVVAVLDEETRVIIQTAYRP